MKQEPNCNLPSADLRRFRRTVEQAIAQGAPAGAHYRRRRRPPRVAGVDVCGRGDDGEVFGEAEIRHLTRALTFRAPWFVA